MLNYINVLLICLAIVELAEYGVASTPKPTSFPTSPIPTFPPSAKPSVTPSAQPTVSPSFAPSFPPTRYPTSYPSGKPSYLPTARPTTHPAQHVFVCDVIASTNIKQLVGSSNVWDCSGSGTPLSNPCLNWPLIECSGNNITSVFFNNSGLTGSIPTSIGKIYSLSEIMIKNNQIQGTLPSQLGNLQYLNSLIIVNTSISGSIPRALSYIPSLEILNLESNRFNGDLDPMFCPTLNVLSRLTILSISHNPNITCLPDCIANLSHTFLFSAVQSNYNLTYCSVLCK